MMPRFKLQVLLSPDDVQKALVTAALSKVDLGITYRSEDAKAEVIDRSQGVFVATITLEVR